MAMHYIHEHPSGAQIIFGLEWSPLIGTNTERLGQQRARMMNATHYVLTRSFHGCAVGIVRVEGYSKKNNLSLHAAATIFAENYPQGAQGCLLTTKEGACWMLVCHAGVVLSHTDQWYVDESQALEAIEPIRQRFPSLQLHRESLVDAQNWPAWLNTTLNAQSALKQIRYSSLSSSKWFYLVFSLLIIVAATSYMLHQKKSLVTDDSPLDMENAWRQSLRVQSQQTFWHSYTQLKSVTDSWMNIPVLPMGWRLTKIQCELGALQWNCSARFIRQHRMATNSHLEKIKPVGWQVDFSPLEDAAFVWRVSTGVSTLELDEPWMRMDWISYLQKVSAAYEHIQIGQTLLIPLKAPLNTLGHPLPALSIFPAWTQRTLVFKGPLRSFTSLEGFHMPVRWRRVTLNVDRQAALSMNRSLLTLELIGDMFESTAQ
jgi:hypothetical protein